MSMWTEDHRVSWTARTLLAGTAMATVFAFGAVAQDAPDEEAAEEADDVIVVTSTRRETDILDVPYNISAISGAALEESVTLDNAELIRAIPGVSLIDQGPRNAARFNSIRIRGLNVDDSNNGDFATASVASVATYVNETPVFANLALIDLDRVEILRGPQGTLYGSGALGGAIRYILRAPQLGEYEGGVGATASHVNGSDDIGLALDGTVNVPFGETFAIRANLAYADLPGITDYVNLYELDANGAPTNTGGVFGTGEDAATFTSQEDADTYEYLYGRLSARWEPNDQFDLTFNYLYQDDEVGGRRQQTEGVDGFGRTYGEYESGAVILEPSSREVGIASLEANVDFGFATLTSATSLYDIEGDSETDSSGFWANGGIVDFYALFNPDAGAFTGAAPLLYRTPRTYSDEAFVQEVRLVSATEGPIDWLVGAYYQDQERTLTQRSDYVGFEAFADAYAATFFLADFASTDTIFDYARVEEFQDFALFGEATWHVSERFRLTGGLRYFENESDVSTEVGVGAFDSVRAVGEETSEFSRSEDDVIFKINAALDLGDDDLLYATISEGYRRGGNNAVVIETPPFFDNAPGWTEFESDTVTNYEVGLKGTWNDIRYDASVFFVDWQDPQLNTFAPAGDFFAVANGDAATTRGLEFQANGNFTDDFAYALGYAYVDAELDGDFINPASALVAPDGASLPGVPEHAVNVAFNYRKPINETYTFIGIIDGYYQSETENLINVDDPDTRTFDGFQIWDASATVAAGFDWDATLFVKNIFNEDGVTGSFSVDDFGPNTGNEFYGSNSRLFIALPRTYGLTLNYNF